VKFRQLNPVIKHSTRGKFRPCIGCRTELNTEAWKCPRCQSYQKSWVNRLEYLGKVIGVVSAVAAAVVYGISQAPEIRKILFWRDSVEVVSIDPFTNTVVLTNSGDGAVYVSSISFTVEMFAGGKDVILNAYTLGAVIASKSTSTVQLGQSADKDRKTNFSPKGYNFASDGLQWLAALRNSGNLLEVTNGDKCFLQVFTLKSNSFLTEARESFLKAGANQVIPGIRTFPAVGTLNFQSLDRKTTYSEPIETVGLLRAADRPGC
jgi:hypothetical protein